MRSKWPIPHLLMTISRLTLHRWYYVPYKPGALVINIGDTLEIVSGGHFKATRHRVFKPPVDQRNSDRLSLVQFNSSVGDLRKIGRAHV